jgi:hypothetical protein
MITVSIAITPIRIVITTLAVMTTTMITMAPHYKKLDGSRITDNNIGMKDISCQILIFFTRL